MIIFLHSKKLQRKNLPVICYYWLLSFLIFFLFHLYNLDITDSSMWLKMLIVHQSRRIESFGKAAIKLNSKYVAVVEENNDVREFIFKFLKYNCFCYVNTAFFDVQNEKSIRYFRENTQSNVSISLLWARDQFVENRISTGRRRGHHHNAAWLFLEIFYGRFAILAGIKAATVCLKSLKRCCRCYTAWYMPPLWRPNKCVTRSVYRNFPTKDRFVK